MPEEAPLLAEDEMAAACQDGMKDGARPADSVTSAGPPCRHRIEFDGRAGEYFRIWGVNLFLTVITLGIYAAWAKVRTRRYFYAHTRLAGRPFDYLAEPVVILKGNLIVAAGVLLYSAVNHLQPKLSALVAFVFTLAVPFLIYKTLRFFAHNTSYRNLRCRFHGGLGECYRIYLLLPILIPFTLGLIVPYWAYCRQRYFFANLAYGVQRAHVTVQVKDFYRWYGVALGLSLLILGGGAGLGGVLAWAWTMSPLAAGADQPETRMKIVTGCVMVCGYGASLLLFIVVPQYLKARAMNGFLNHLTLGGLRFDSAIGARRLAWIQASNLVLMIVSLGGLIPWATMRRNRYLLERITVLEEAGELDRFAAASSLPESGLGDAATDFFDLDIGF